MNGLTNTLAQLLSGSAPSQRVPALGERELEVMKILWHAEPLSAKEVLQRVSDDDLSLSTMQSTLERLYRKNLLQREKAVRYYIYRTKMARSEIISQLLGDITEQICDGDMASMVSGFSDFFAQNSSKPAEEELRGLMGPPSKPSDE